MLLYIGGGIVDTLVADEPQRSFLAQLRSGWVSEFDGQEPLRKPSPAERAPES